MTPASPSNREPAGQRRPRRATRHEAVLPDEPGVPRTPRSAAQAERLRRGLTLAQRREQRREDLLEAALELFGTKGFAATSIDELCRTAYVSTRNFYEEFTGREAVLEALAERIGDELFEALSSVPVATDARFSTAGAVSDEFVNNQTRARIGAVVHTLLDDPRKGRIALLEMTGTTPERAEWRRRADRALVHFLIGLFRDIVHEVDVRLEASLEDYVSPVAQEYIAIATVGAVNQILTDWMLRDERPPIEETVDWATFTVIRLVGLGDVTHTLARYSRRSGRERAAGSPTTDDPADAPAPKTPRKRSPRAAG